MQLMEALRIIRDHGRSEQAIARDESPQTVALACGSTPLHLRTLLTAELIRRQAVPRRLEIPIGLFGDLCGTLESLAETGRPDATVVVIEWSDLDPRLGWRTSGGWRPDRLADIAASVSLKAAAIRTGIIRLAETVSVAVVPPTLPLPPFDHAPLGMASPVATGLQQIIAELCSDLSAVENVRVLDSQWLLTVSPLDARHDIASDLLTGYPYTASHAAVLAEAVADLLQPPATLKGLITDLDDTLWAGIVGDDGVAGVSWSLDQKSHQHALYQDVLAGLAESGVLVGVASKNEPDVVEAALRRRDLVIPADRLFPVLASWRPKSESVASILRTWNIAADDVLFIDDNPLELAEVQAAFPTIQTRQFPRAPADVVALLRELRSMFGRAMVSAEDRLRSNSLRSASIAAQAAEAATDPDEFLSRAEAELHFTWNRPDHRCLELINKTNQFNLNGERIDDVTWRRSLESDDCVLLSVAYADKFGPLGTISVLQARWTEPGDSGASVERKAANPLSGTTVSNGQQRSVAAKVSETVGNAADRNSPRISLRQNHTDIPGPVLTVDAWVLSCRAFSRRIEHATLRALFDHTGAEQIVLKFASTPRNVPLQNLLALLTGSRPDDGPIVIHRDTFEAGCPKLFARMLHDDQPGESLGPAAAA